MTHAIATYGRYGAVFSGACALRLRAGRFALALGLVASVAGGIPDAQATQLDIYQHSGYLDFDGYGAPLAAPAVPGPFDGSAFTGAGFGVSYATSLNANNLGSLSWTVMNNTGAAVTGVRFLAYLDADIVDAFQDPFNESASFQGMGLPSGAPSGAIGFSSYEADDPDFGDILSNVAAGTLDGTNAVDDSACDPAITGFGCGVALALGFNVGSLAAGEAFVAELLLTSPFGSSAPGIVQADYDSAELFLFNGYVTLRAPVTAPAPSSLALLMAGLGGWRLVRRRRDRARKVIHR